jgi:hypothetical protein
MSQTGCESMAAQSQSAGAVTAERYQVASTQVQVSVSVAGPQPVLTS